MESHGYKEHDRLRREALNAIEALIYEQRRHVEAQAEAGEDFFQAEREREHAYMDAFDLVAHGTRLNP